MENQKSDINLNRPPVEQLIIEKWERFWDPPKDGAVKRLIDRFKYQTEFKNRKHDHKEEPVEISKNIIENELGFSNFPKKIPSWVELDKNGNQTHHQEKKINPNSEFKKKISDSEIGNLFRKYYKNILKSRISIILLYFSIILVISNFMYLFSIWGFKWSPFADFFESNPMILLYLGIPTIYAIITVLFFMSVLKVKVKPSKWHWFDIIVIILILSLYYLFEFGSNLSFLNFFVNDIPPINLRDLIEYYNLFNSFIILILAITSIGYSIIPCTPKGQLFYSFLKLEYSFKIEQASEVKKIPKFFHSAIISLNELLIKYFDLSIKNLSEIEGSFNAKLLKKGRKFFTENFTISNDDNLLEYFSNGIILNKKEKVIGQRLKKEDKIILKDQEYLITLTSIQKVIDKIDFNSKEPIFVRITLKDRLRYKFQIISSILFAGFSFTLSNILPLFL